MRKSLFLAAAAALLTVFACQKPDNNQTPSGTSETLSVSPKSVTLPAEGGSAKVAIETNAASVTASSSETWLTATVSGKELQLLADANPSTEPRTATVTVKGATASATVSVTQEKGSKYPGYKAASLSESSYMGIMMLKMMGVEGYDGGEAVLRLVSEDKRYEITLDLYTECFASAEEVTLTTGTYTKGNDDMSQMILEGKKLTWIPGALMVLEDEEGSEELQYGSFIVETIGETQTVYQLAEGSLTITEDNGAFLIKTDLKTKEGADVKYYFEGPVEMEVSASAFPSETDPTQVTGASITYLGAEEEGGPVHLELTLSTDDMFTMSTFSFYVPSVSFEDLPGTDLSGTYRVADPEDETEPANPGDPWTVDLGSLLSFGDFSFPSGSFIMFSFGDYFVPDGMVSLVLDRKEDGRYVITGAMANADFSEYYMFTDDKTSFEITYSDDTAGDDDDEDYED